MLSVTFFKIDPGIQGRSFVILSCYVIGLRDFVQYSLHKSAFYNHVKSGYDILVIFLLLYVNVITLLNLVAMGF